MSKIGIIGLGNVGKSYCYSLINKNLCDEIVIIDSNKDILKGNYLDLIDSALLDNTNIKIGEYSDLNDSDIIVITAGKNQKKGETRLELINENKKIIKSICDNINKTNFNGIILVATNPLDVCTYLVDKYINIDSSKIIGSGTFLDTIRLKNILKNKYNTNDVKTYVIGEHGDSSVIVWSKTYINGELISLSDEEKNFITNELHKKAYNIIELKGETSYGIGSSLAYITKQILDDSNIEIIVSSKKDNISISNLFIISKNGVKYKGIDLKEEEEILFNDSKKIINNLINDLEAI